jgi:hypothetical protein
MTQDEEKHITLHKQLEEKKNRTFFYAEIVITINIQYTCKWVLKASETMMVAASGAEKAYHS